MTILTVAEVAEMLKLKPSQVYTMTRKRARQRMEKPLPYLKINGNLRFSKEAIESWLQELSRDGAGS
jgi:predicted DNA-binding transcriptional regulator AlpA